MRVTRHGPAALLLAAALHAPVRAGEPAPVVLCGGVEAPGLDEPVADVRVVVTGPAGVLGETKSDARGRWRLDLATVPAQVAVWTTSADGRCAVLHATRPDREPRWDTGWTRHDRPSRARVLVTGGEPGGTDVTIVPDTTTRTLGPRRTLDPLPCATTIAGRGTGTVLDGASVAFDDLPAGGWAAIARKDGVAVGWTAFRSHAGRALDVALPLRPVAPLTVRLLDGLAAPQAGIRLVCAPAPEDAGPVLLSAAATATTGADGIARFGAVAAGAHLVYVSDGTSLLPVAALRTPLAGADVVPLLRPRTTTLVGVAADEFTGEVAAHADIVARGALDEIPFDARTTADAQGRFALRVPSGAGFVGLGGACAGRFSLAAGNGRTGLDPQRAAEPPRVPAFVSLETGELASGVVNGPSGPVAGARVSLTVRPPNGPLDLRYSGTTDEQGRFAIRVPAGTRSGLTVHGPAFVRDVHRKGSAEDECIVEAGRTIRGRVLDSDRLPVPGVDVGWESKRARTDGDGRFTIREGAMRLPRGGVSGPRPKPEWVVLPAPIAARGDVDVGDVTCPAELLDAPLRETFSRPAARPDGVAALEFAVATPDGRAVVGATVALQAETMSALHRDGPPEIRAVTDARGAARVTGLAGGTWRISVRAAGHGIAAARAQVPAVEQVAVTVSPLRALSGRVVLRTGEPVAGASVEFAPQGGAPPAAIEETAADGTFRFAGLPAGSGALTVRATDSSSASFATAAVTFGGVDLDGVTWRVDAAPTISGVVRDTSDRPVPFVRVAARRADGSSWTTAWTDVAGNFVLRGMTEGRWRIDAGDAHTEAESGAAGVKLTVRSTR